MLGSYIKPFVSLWEKLVGFSYVFLLYVVGEEDLIGFFWLLCWYLLHVADIVVEGFQCCSILCFVNRFPFYRCTVVVKSG